MTIRTNNWGERTDLYDDDMVAAQCQFQLLHGTMAPQTLDTPAACDAVSGFVATCKARYVTHEGTAREGNFLLVHVGTHWSYHSLFLTHPYIDWFLQERHNSSVSTVELRLTCINRSIYGWVRNMFCMGHKLQTFVRLIYFLCVQ